MTMPGFTAGRALSRATHAYISGQMNIMSIDLGVIACGLKIDTGLVRCACNDNVTECTCCVDTIAGTYCATGHAPPTRSI